MEVVSGGVQQGFHREYPLIPNANMFGRVRDA